ncbi:MAG: thiamine diphosphokinase [Bacteroidales bacterium]|nr:thiamine diphosphokinase [Bacteroidales bacterium]
MNFPNLIVANGEKPTHPEVVRLLQQARHIICCDGAVRHLKSLGIQPTAIVGDGDSLLPEDQLEYAALYTPDASTEYNDLTKAFNLCQKLGLDDIAVVGACGLREDHTLANLSLLVKHARQFHAVMYTNYGIFTPIFHTTEFLSRKGQQVSIFSFTPATPLTFHGLRYPVRERCFREFWEGSLNEAEGECFTIELHSSGEILVYQTFENKENQL